MKLLEISEEFIVYPCGNAVKLIAPDSSMIPPSHTFVSLKKVMQFPFNVAFSNTNVCIQKVNEPTVATLGFESPFKGLFFLGYQRIDTWCIFHNFIKNS